MVTYSITNLADKTSHHKNAPCFVAHYDRLKDYKSATVFVEECFMRAKAPHPRDPMWKWNAFTDADYKEYVRLLNVMGFHVTLTHEDKPAQYKFKVNLTKHTVVANKIILNAIRYLCEDPYMAIASEFLRLSKYKGGTVSTYSKFIIAHYIFNIGHGGHTFLPTYNLPLLLKNKEFKALVLDNTKNTFVCDLLPQCKKPVGERVPNPTPKNQWDNWIWLDHRKDLFELFKQGAPLSALHKEYKSLCAKFM